MSRLPVNSTVLALVVAVVLFLIASYFDDRAGWQPPQSVPQATMNPARPTGLTETLRTTDTAGACDRAESELLQTVESSRHCSSDDDCTLVDFGYPIQCMTSVSRDEVTALRLQFRQYESSCRFRVYYDCPTDGAERLAVCRSNRCTVELETIDSLRNETLDYLGIGR